MARIFSINFRYDEVERIAMITVRTTPFATEYTITMLHEELKEELPSQKILSTSNDHFVFVNYPFEEPTPLMKEIVRALADHVQTFV